MAMVTELSRQRRKISLMVIEHFLFMQMLDQFYFAVWRILTGLKMKVKRGMLIRLAVWW
jgi:hypothetical protein